MHGQRHTAPACDSDLPMLAQVSPLQQTKEEKWKLPAPHWCAGAFARIQTGGDLAFTLHLFKMISC